MRDDLERRLDAVEAKVRWLTESAFVGVALVAGGIVYYLFEHEAKWGVGLAPLAAVIAFGLVAAGLEVAERKKFPRDSN